MPNIKHYEHCNANYPEKVVGELPQTTIVINIDENTAAIQCVDCGAFVLEEQTDAKQTGST